MNRRCPDEKYKHTSSGRFPSFCDINIGIGKNGNRGHHHGVPGFLSIMYHKNPTDFRFKYRYPENRKVFQSFLDTKSATSRSISCPVGCPSFRIRSRMSFVVCVTRAEIATRRDSVFRPAPGLLPPRPITLPVERLNGFC